MATLNSGNHHKHQHQRNLTDDSGNFHGWNNNNNNADDDHDPINQEKPMSKSSRKLARKPQQRTIPVAGNSLPVNIPEWPKVLRDSDGDGGDEWLPPHEYLAKIRGASLSVHEGGGRTLKGRDLSRLRNAIWKQTGFELD